jgi:4-methylaminobutanoate oxidase (formaldehyde-forming)
VYYTVLYRWFESVRREHEACRESVVLFDMTSFSKLLVQGRDALRLLQHLGVNDVDVTVGNLVYTSMCNSRGGIESDITVCRLADEKFLITTATAQATRDAHWINTHIAARDFMRDDDMHDHDPEDTCRGGALPPLSPSWC